MTDEQKNIPDLNKAQNRHTHLTKVKNDFITFLLKEIKTHFDNLNETRLELTNTILTDNQVKIVDQLKSESDHSYILIDEILSFLDVDTVKYGLHELQFDLKDYFDKRRNKNLSKDFAEKHPLNILFWEEDQFNRKFARIVFDCLGYMPDFTLSLSEGTVKEYDVVFVDLSKNKNILREQSDTIYAYFSDKKRPQLIALSQDDISDEQKTNFQHGIDWNLITPVKIKDLMEMVENASRKSRSESSKPVVKYIPETSGKRFIEEDKISFIQEIQSEEDIVFFIELIDIFIIETPKIFKIVRDAIKKLDYEKIHFGGHKLRGSSLTMGIDLFIDIGARLEQNARSKNIEDAELLVAELEHKFVIVVQELEEIKDKYRIKYLGDFN